MDKKYHTVPVKLSTDQYNLARRRMFAEDMSWQEVLVPLLNAYIMGDVTVTRQGRYYLHPPRDGIPIIEIPKKEDKVELEPDWNIGENRPQVSADKPQQKPRNLKDWGTRQVAVYLREETGRKISIPVLRQLLSLYEIPKGNNSRWSFTGGDDPHVQTLKQAIEDGTYDTLLREGTQRAVEARKRKQQELDELAEAEEITNERRRQKHLERIRKIQNHE